MNTENIIGRISTVVKQAQADKVNYEQIWSESSGKRLKHEFLFFIKPEITKSSTSIDLHEILHTVFEKLNHFHLCVEDIRLLSANYLKQYNIIARHYGVINQMSKNPQHHLSAEAKANFFKLFGKHPDKVQLTGSIDFIEKYPDYNPFTLNDLWKNSVTSKLAGGTYCAPVSIGGEEVYLINGFHPLQLIHFTEKGRSIVVFRLSGDTDWSVARNSFIGKTNPADALPGSLRNILLTREKHFGLSDISASQNGFHLSAGPVEGLVELIRYLSDYSGHDIRKTGDFNFGKSLQAHFTDKEVETICNNSIVNYKGALISVFDLTEEKNSNEALELLKESHL